MSSEYDDKAYYSQIPIDKQASVITNDHKNKRIKCFNMQNRMKTASFNHHRVLSESKKNMNYKNVFYRSGTSDMNDSNYAGSKLLIFNYFR